MFTFSHVNPTLVSWMNQCFFIGQFSSKLDKKSIISHQGFSSGFLMEKWSKFARFQSKEFQITRFLWEVSVGSEEYKRFCIFLLSYLQFSQIWLNHFLDDCHFCYITKSLGKILVWISIFREKIKADLYNKIKMVHLKIRRIRFRETTHDPWTM